MSTRVARNCRLFVDFAAVASAAVLLGLPTVALVGYIFELAS